MTDDCIASKIFRYTQYKTGYVTIVQKLRVIQPFFIALVNYICALWETKTVYLPNYCDFASFTNYILD